MTTLLENNFGSVSAEHESGIVLTGCVLAVGHTFNPGDMSVYYWLTQAIHWNLIVRNRDMQLLWKSGIIVIHGYNLTGIGPNSEE